MLGILLFVGFEAAASLGEESHDPARSIPRALIGTVGASAALLRDHVLRDLDRARQDGGRQGRMARSDSALDNLATQYIGSWYATIIDLVVILDATALALAICVTIGRGYFALGPRRPAALVLREDVASQHAVGGQPGGRVRWRRSDPGRALQSHPRPVRPAPQLRRLLRGRDGRVVCGRARLPDPGGGRDRPAGAHKGALVAVPGRAGRGRHAGARASTARSTRLRTSTST